MTVMEGAYGHLSDLYITISTYFDSSFGDAECFEYVLKVSVFPRSCPINNAILSSGT